MKWIAPMVVALFAGGTALAQPVAGDCNPDDPGAACALVSSLDEIAEAADPLPVFAGALSCHAPTRTVAGKTVSLGADGSLSFRSGLAIDADGAPNAYGPGGLGLDYLANAGSPGHWWGVAVGPDGEPYVQGPDDPFPGYYVSTTSLEDPDFAESDPRRYVDSTKIHFLALPPSLFGDGGVRMGDVAAVEYEGRVVFAIVADQGPAGKLGEGSIALAEALGIDSNAKHGGLDTPGLHVVLFPGTGTGRPMTQAQIDTAARAALEAGAASCNGPG